MTPEQKERRRLAEMRKRFADLPMKEKYEIYGIKTIGYLDIETSGLTADFDIMLSWAVLIRDTRTEKCIIKHGIVTKEDFEYAHNKKDADLIDKRITKELIEAIKGVDLLIGHWFIGKHRHDIPFIRTRCVINKVHGFPHYKKVRYGDTQKTGSILYRNRNNSLDTMNQMYNGHVHKTPLSPKIWKNACIGVKDALEYVLKHNIHDVKITKLVHMGQEEWAPIPSTWY